MKIDFFSFDITSKVRFEFLPFIEPNTNWALNFELKILILNSGKFDIQEVDNDT